MTTTANELIREPLSEIQEALGAAVATNEDALRFREWLKAQISSGAINGDAEYSETDFLRWIDEAL